jgi:hypothetical protein
MFMFLRYAIFSFLAIFSQTKLWFCPMRIKNLTKIYIGIMKLISRKFQKKRKLCVPPHPTSHHINKKQEARKRLESMY